MESMTDDEFIQFKYSLIKKSIDLIFDMPPSIELSLYRAVTAQCQDDKLELDTDFYEADGKVVGMWLRLSYIVSDT